MSDRELDTTRFPRCSECGGEVRLMERLGRVREVVRGTRLSIPDNFAIPTCVRCGEEFSLDVSEKLDAVLASQRHDAAEQADGAEVPP
jgi:DNA-directed RNA polymerase subunit RPC12/RpoP